MRKINWLNHFLEFIVVLLGILLAFQLNTCSANKKQAKIIETHEQQLFEETELNEANFDVAIKFSESNLNQIDTLLRLLHSDGELAKINLLSIKLLNIGGLYIRKNAYRSLIETGDIRFMTDFKSKNEIINLYEYYNWVEATEEAFMKIYQKNYFPYLNKNFDMARASVQEKEVYFNKEFINSLSSYRFTLAMKLQKYKDGKKEIEKFLNNTK